MKQNIIGGAYQSLPTSGTKYACLSGGGNIAISGAWQATLSSVQTYITTPGTISGLRIKLSDAPGASKSYIFNVQLNGADTLLTCTVSGTATTGSDLTNTIAVVAGDLVNLSCTASGTPTTSYAQWASLFTSTNTAESLLLFLTGVETTSDGFSPLSSSQFNGYDGVENNMRQVCPTAGTLKNLYIRLSQNPGGGTKGYNFTVRKNGVNTLLTVTVSGTNTTGNDTTNAVTVIAGDVLTLSTGRVNSPSNAAQVSGGLTFVATVDGESIILGGTSDGLSASATEYVSPQSSGLNEVWFATEAQRQQLISAASELKKLYVLLSGAPGAGKSFTFTLRDAGDTSLAVTISDTNTTGNNTSVSVIALAADSVSLQVVPTSTPAAYAAYWGLVCVIISIPATPSNVSPADGATDINLTPTLGSSAFSGSGTHLASQWQVKLFTDADWNSPKFDSGEDTTNLVSISLSTSLDLNMDYQWRVRHENEAGWSEWSTATVFSTEKRGILVTCKLFNRTLSQKLSNRTLTLKAKSV